MYLDNGFDIVYLDNGTDTLYLNSDLITKITQPFNNNQIAYWFNISMPSKALLQITQGFDNLVAANNLLAQ